MTVTASRHQISGLDIICQQSRYGIPEEIMPIISAINDKAKLQIFTITRKRILFTTKQSS